MFTLVVGAFLWAQEGPQEPTESGLENAIEEREKNLHALWKKLSDDELLNQIHELQLTGKYDSAQQKLDYLVERSPYPFFRLEWAKNHELMELYDIALDEYTALLQEDLDPPLQLDVLYRMAIVLDDMGQYKKAIGQFQAIQRRKELLKKGDREQLELLIGAAMIRQGRQYCGVRRLNKALASMPKKQSPWSQARARYALVLVLVQSAEKVAMKQGNKMAKSITKRLQRMRAAERQIAVILELREPEYALLSLIAVVDAYLRFYDDAVSMPAPKHFTVVQHRQYEEQLAKKAETLRRKAHMFAREGVNYADTMGWQRNSRSELIQRRDLLKQERKDY